MFFISLFQETNVYESSPFLCAVVDNEICVLESATEIINGGYKEYSIAIIPTEKELKYVYQDWKLNGYSKRNMNKI